MQPFWMEPVVESQVVLSLSLSHARARARTMGVHVGLLADALVYRVGPNGWKKLSGDDVGELHYKYYPVMPSTVEQEMVEVAGP